MQREDVLNLVLTCLSETLTDCGQELAEPASETTSLVGRSSTLDSLGLVQLLVALEQQLQEQHDVLITVADDRAMSQRNSPFRTVGTLTDYVQMLVGEQRSYART